MLARYQSPGRGNFTSEDPVFLALGNAGSVKQLSGQDQQLSLSDPQELNSYSYGRDNPITKSDPSGLFDILNGVVQKVIHWYDYASYKWSE